MKRSFYLLILLLLLGCSKNNEMDNPDTPDVPEIETPTVILEVSPNELIFEAEGGEKSFTIQAYFTTKSEDVEWEITNDCIWCRTDVTHGKGERTVYLSANAYSEMDDRNTNLIVKAGDQTKILTVTQKHVNALILDKDKFDVSQEGGNIDIEVKSTIDYNVIIPSKFNSWIKQKTESKSLSNKSFHFIISANDNTEKREGYIIFESSVLRDTVRIYQAQKNELVFSEKNYNVSSAGEEFLVDLRTNVDYDITVPDSVSHWVSISQTKASRVDRFNVSIAKNETAHDRKAVILIKDKNSSLSDTLHIHQPSKNAIILSPKVIDVQADGATIEVELQANIDYSIVIPKSALEWISNVQTKTDLRDKIYLKIARNTTYDDRTAEIIIEDRNTDLKETLHIKQYAKNTIILSRNEYNIPAKGRQLSVEIKSNMEYEVLIGKNERNWIQQIPQSKGLTTDVLTLNVTENTSDETRTAEIVVKSKINDLSDTLHVKQLSREAVSVYTGDIILRCEQDLLDFSSAGYTKVQGNVWIQGILHSLQSLDNMLTEINGSLSIQGGGYVTLDGLRNLEKISGDLLIWSSNIKSLEGLENLTTVGGHLGIYTYGMESFEGLENLNSVGSLKVYFTETFLPLLTSFKGFDKLQNIRKDFEVDIMFGSSVIGGTPQMALESFVGLESLETIGGNFKITISYTSASSFSSFNGLNNLKSIGGDFEINANIYYSSSLTSLKSFEGLESLQSIGGNFKIISPSSSFTSLTSFKGLSSLRSIGKDFELSCSYSSATNFLTALESFEGLEKLESIGGDFKMASGAESSFTSLASFRGLNNLRSIGKNFELNCSHPSATNFLSALESFEGLEKLESIGGDFKMTSGAESSFTSLASFRGLNNLQSIGKDFELSCSYSSKTNFLTALESFEGLEKLRNIGGNFKIDGYYNSIVSFASLASFSGLENLETIKGGKIEIKNLAALNNIDALRNIQTLEDISISGCKQLYDFCILKNVVQNMSGNGKWYCNSNGYNPNKEQLLNGQCAKTPSE